MVASTEVCIFHFSSPRDSQCCFIHHPSITQPSTTGKTDVGWSQYHGSTASDIATQVGMQPNFNQRHTKGSLLRDLRKFSLIYEKVLKAIFFPQGCGHSLWWGFYLLKPSCSIPRIASWVGQSWENCREIQSEPLDNSSSKVHLNTKFPAMQANNFPNVSSILSFLLLMNESLGITSEFLTFIFVTTIFQSYIFGW